MSRRHHDSYPRPVVVGHRLVGCLERGPRVSVLSAMGSLTYPQKLEAAQRLREAWPGEVSHEEALQLLRRAWMERFEEDWLPDG